jgi:hypothetical protein
MLPLSPGKRVCFPARFRIRIQCPAPSRPCLFCPVARAQKLTLSFAPDFQRKTRCDPTLPRCLPCERSGSTCEYFDTTKGKKISRFYVVKLQEKVRALEAELGQYTDEDDFPKNDEDFVRPGGLVRLNESDETPRYLGPSSGIAMTRILMEEAKRYTDSSRISELIPEVRDRRQAAPHISALGMRSHSLAMPPQMAARKKSYPMISAVPAQNLPSRAIADKLVDVFHQRGKSAGIPYRTIA